MSRFSNFELEQNLEAKTNELGNFLIDPTDNLSFASNNCNFLQANVMPREKFTNEYYSYPSYNPQSVYPMLNPSIMYYPTSSATVQHNIPKNYQRFSNNMNLTSLNNNYEMPPQPITLGSVCNQSEMYGIKSVHHDHHQHITPIPNLSLNSNAALSSQTPPVKVFNKNCYQPKKHFQNDKKLVKFNKHNNLVKDIQRDLSPIIVSLEKLRIGPNFPNPSELFAILSLFRQLSHYTIQMCKERRSLETLYLSNVTGYTPDSNYLPAVIKDISNHIKLTKQAIGHEFYEIKKLIGSIKICQYGNMNQLNDKFHMEIINLEKYEHLHIKHKNGMLLLSNDKIVSLISILTNIIVYVRLYTVYVTTLKYKISKERRIALVSTTDEGYGHVEGYGRGRTELRRIGV